MPNNLVFLGIEFLRTKREAVALLSEDELISFISLHQQLPCDVSDVIAFREMYTYRTVVIPRLNARKSARDQSTPNHTTVSGPFWNGYLEGAQ